jgi:hypothetical protein
LLFENQLDITIKAFFFNAKTDYLPYYKNFSFTVKKDMVLKEILPLIKEQNSMFAYPDKDLIFRVNGLVVTGIEKVSEVVEELGTELKIDPALEYRSDNGLILNNHDFMHQYRRVFQRHNTSKEDLEYYLTLYPLHYASETFNYNREYIGDAIILLAAKMVNDGHHNIDEILHDISDEFNGICCCEYENNLFNGEDYGQTIESLKKMVQHSKSKLSLKDKIRAMCLKNMRKSIKIDSLQGKNIALYVGDEKESKLLHIDEIYKTIASIGKLISFDMSTRRAGQSLMERHPTIAHQKAAKMMLQAFDAGAEVLVFSKDEDMALFEKKIAIIESEVGREIGLALLSLSTFNEMSRQIA